MLADEKVNRRSAFEGEAILFRHVREDFDEERYLSPVRFIERHRDLPG